MCACMSGSWRGAPRELDEAGLVTAVHMTIGVGVVPQVKLDEAGHYEGR